MIRVVLDSNVVIDALRPNPEFEADAKRIFGLIGQDVIQPYLCANSLTDIFYILKKVQGAEKTKETISKLMVVFNIVPLTARECVDALKMSMGDFEDAIIAVSAQNLDVDYIISRDEKFINANTTIEVILPRQIMEIADKL